MKSRHHTDFRSRVCLVGEAGKPTGLATHPGAGGQGRASLAPLPLPLAGTGTVTANAGGTSALPRWAGGRACWALRGLTPLVSPLLGPALPATVPL